MRLTGWTADYTALGPIKITLECIGTEDELRTVKQAYANDTEIYQLISLTGPGEKENKTMNKETKTFTAIDLLRIEKESYDKGYKRGREVGFREGSSSHAGFIYQLINNGLKIKKVIFNDPATIVFWADGTKTVAKAHGDDKFDKEIGLTVCIAKKALGNRSNFDKVFKKWIKED